MLIEFDKSFINSIDIIQDPKLLSKIEDIIIKLENVESINHYPNIKKLVGYKNYYRIRIGDYRLGFELINSSTIRFIVFLHRKEIYKKFPK